MIQKSAEVRKAFLSFFQERGHQVVPSSSLLPLEDPTLLFTSAGMVQFKKFWATEIPLPYSRATSCQKSLRAGGKDSDLEMVGRSGKHHTFFEMLGNFSFGDYFKKEAIGWAYEFVTEHLKIPPEILWVSYYEEDEETRTLWLERLPAKRIIPLGARDNFWGPAGDTGPCGPCTELYYDFGPEKSCGKTECQPGCDCGRFLEFWNLVFPQYDQQPDGSRTPLKRRGVDTGMGLERICRILQKTETNYETDLFLPIITCLEKMSGQSYQEEKKRVAFRIVSDHLRAAVFLLDENLVPGNEGRSYVLRNIIRRACLAGIELNLTEPFLHRLAQTLIEQMSPVYSSLQQHRNLILELLREEEERFYLTSEASARRFREFINREGLQGKTIPGEMAFKLYGTLGIRRDLLMRLAREEGLSVDWAGFEKCLEEEKERSRVSSVFQENREVIFSAPDISSTKFVGYEVLSARARLRAVFKNQRTELLEVVLDATPFYPEKGGQLGDRGTITADGLLFRVEDTQGDEKGVIYHAGRLEKGRLEDLIPGLEVTAVVDRKRRRAIAANHTATHLLHFALRTLIGRGTRQAGSYVGPERLRFDFTCNRDVTREKLTEIETLVQEKIFEDAAVETKEVPLEEAIKDGAVALFIDRYGEKVRMVRTGGFHAEVCGGTHVERTGQIGVFKITASSSIGKNLKRIEAVTGPEAIAYLNRGQEILEKTGELLGVDKEKVLERVARLKEELTEKERRLEQAEAVIVEQLAAKLKEDAEKVKFSGGEVRLVVARVKVWSRESLGRMADRIES
ncbi:MAG TPA: alanine--tRNA ligase, partial [bacterium]|nr:alanine--tRNA ligase [bacterium]